MKFFDCNVCFGRPMIRPIRFAETAKDLLKEMDFYGIDEALVFHSRQRDDSPVVGNEILLNEIKDVERLYGTFAILPPQTGEMDSFEDLLEKMRLGNIRAFRAFPSEHKFLMTRVALGSLYDFMIERNIPLFIPINESCGGISGWYLIEQILSNAPDLTLVVVEHGSWGQDRFFRPLIEKYENLYLDISRYELDGGISDFCAKYGAERLLFGTGYPWWNPGGPILMLTQADVTTREREKIASGNLKRIFGRVRI
ncbi:amidohydrolase family protein [Candidatus Bathyarchaeota archaeon]|nr:amidohydrolase family protein [Candidatus Bathyarchaeota archaeon]MBS7613746.1 amidohydrolase family protein [Candidatus Bathyarchaeota archaeon]MBS7618439.1 amidohydrolase family protein [Candidatus Bathyarchaeota archaeon]